MNKLIAYLLSIFAAMPVIATASLAQAGQTVAPILHTQATNSTLKNNLTDKGSIYVTNLVNNAIKSKMLTVDIGANAALANSTTYVGTVSVGRACQVIAINACAQVAPIGGTNTLTIAKNNSSTLLSTANFNPTAMVNNTASILPLTSTTSTLQLAATDTITVTWVSGVQTTAAVGPSVTIEVIPTAEY